MANTIDVTCDNMSLSINIAKTRKQPSYTKNILKNINVNFKPGRLTAIMGASGAGKTCLLGLLSGDVAEGAALEGNFLVNGNSVEEECMKRLSGFVFQDDVLFSTMTVEEAIMMSATLRLPSSISRKEKIGRVDEIIKLLGLQAARNVKIGSPLQKGISGGERKRVCIAMEMVTNPSVLFLDEPTSGLDTFTAHSVVSQLKSLAKQGRTVVSTIHQPSCKTFMLFDDLLLLADGQVVYNGPVDKVLRYLSEKVGMDCPTFMNPADFLFMEVLNGGEGADNERADGPLESKELMIEISNGQSSRNQMLIECWRDSSEQLEILSNIKEIKNAKSDQALDHSSFKENSFMSTQFSFLLARSAKDALRNPMVLFVRAAKALLMGILVGSMYFDVSSKGAAAQTNDRIFSLFFLCTNELFSVLGSSVFMFSVERPVFLREYRNGYYSIIPYFLSKVIVDIPISLFCPILTVAFFYPLVGFRSEFGAFAGILLSAQMIALVGSGLGLWLGAMFPNFQVAMALFPFITLPMMLFGGVQVNLEGIPKLLKWMPYVSPLRWAFSSMAQLELKDLQFPVCESFAPCNGNDSLKLFGLHNDPSIWFNWSVLMFMYGVCILAALFFLWRSAVKK